MVRLHIKRGDESQFLYDTTVNENVDKVIQEICAIFNGRLKISRVSDEIKYLAEHGPMLPPEMIGLTDEQVQELKLQDSWADKCIPSGGYEYNKDDIGRRNGRSPKADMQKVLNNAVEESRSMIDKKLVLQNIPLTLKKVQEALDLLKGAVTIVYPMQLPPHDNIRMEFTNTEDLSGTQALKDIIEPSNAQLWFAGHQVLPGKLLKDAIGANDKTKVIMKLTKCNESAPGREPVMTEEIRKQLMLQAYRREEELKVRNQKEFIQDHGNKKIISCENDKGTTSLRILTTFKVVDFYLSCSPQWAQETVV